MGEAAVFFVGGEIAQAEGGGVGGIALIDLLEGEIFGLDFVFAGFHGFAVVGIEDRDRAVIMDAEAELFGGGFVVGESEAVADAGAVNGMVDERGAPISRAATVFSTRVPKGRLRVSFSALASRRATREVS